VGDVGIVPDYLNGANLTENAVKLTNLRDVDAHYLKYCLLTHEAQEKMKNFASGSAQDKLGIYKVKEIEIPKLHPKIQYKITAILLAYDRLIENNTRRIKILEEMARSLYDE
jgi:type I restriction enzyme S subunit